MTNAVLDAPRRPRFFLVGNPSVILFIFCLAVFTLAVTVLAEGFGVGVISTSFVKTLGKTLACAWSHSPWTWSGGIAAS